MNPKSFSHLVAAFRTESDLLILPSLSASFTFISCIFGFQEFHKQQMCYYFHEQISSQKKISYSFLIIKLRSVSLFKKMPNFLSHFLEFPSSLHCRLTSKICGSSHSCYLACFRLRGESESCSVVSSSLRPQGSQLVKFLCPWNSPGKNPGVDCHSLLQGIFPTWRLNPGCLNCRQILYHLSYQGSPLYDYMPTKNLLSIFIGLFYYQ